MILMLPVALLRIFIFAGAVVSAALTAPSIAEASDCDAVENNLVSNCGFETGDVLDVDGWTVEWTVEFPDEYGWYGGVATTSPEYANSGIGFIYVAGDPDPNEPYQLEITQAVTLERGATYEISLEVATLDSDNQFISSEFGLVLGFVYSQQQQIFSEVLETDGGYTQFSYEVVADSSVAPLLGIGLGATASPYVLLDDVVVVKKPPTPVPFMPMYLILALSGLLGLFGFSRIRASK